MKIKHLLILFLLSISWVFAQKPKQANIGYKVLKVLKKDGFEFKDLNKNGILDAYEDWRLPVDLRVKNLLSQMTLEEKVGFMLISTTRMANDGGFGPSANPNAPISSGFNEEDLVQNVNMFTRKPLSEPNMSASGTTKAITERQLRHFILRANTSAKTMAEWSNNLQALCESTRLGIQP